MKWQNHFSFPIKQQNDISPIINDLLQNGFVLYVCSDHGSTIAKGNGKIIDKYLQDKFAKRWTVISKDTSVLTEHQKIEIPFIIDRLVVIPENREMFAGKNKYEINHGGISFDEMVVPFVKIVNSYNMLGFDRPLKPEWIYKTLQLVEPGKKPGNFYDAYQIAMELTGKDGRRKTRTVLFRTFIYSFQEKQSINKNNFLIELSKKHHFEYMNPVYMAQFILK